MFEIKARGCVGTWKRPSLVVEAFLPFGTTIWQRVTDDASQQREASQFRSDFDMYSSIQH